jgi:MFS superfamily sulfate permease-like transporter
VLAALIIHALWHIIASRKLQQLRLVTRVEFWLGMLALAGVVLIDVLEGMIIGLVASLVFVIYKLEPTPRLLAGARTGRARRLFRSRSPS